MKQSVKITEPWPHYELENFFSEQVHGELHKIVYDSQSEWELEDNLEPRYYIPIRKRDYNTNKLTKSIVDHVTNKDNIDKLNRLSNNHLIGDDLYCHYRITKDLPGYKKECHVDIKTLFTLMVWITDQDDVNYGSEILNDDMSFNRDTIYKDNAGYMFFTDNGHLTYHSYVKHCPVDRYAFMYNIYREKDFLSIYSGNESIFDLAGKKRAIFDLKDTLFNINDLLETQKNENCMG